MFGAYSCGHGEELAERVGAPLMAGVALDADAALRAAAARAIPDLARMCCSDACIDLVDLLEKVTGTIIMHHNITVVI